MPYTTLWFSDVFRGYGNKTLACDWLILGFVKYKFGRIHEDTKFTLLN